MTQSTELARMGEVGLELPDEEQIPDTSATVLGRLLSPLRGNLPIHLEMLEHIQADDELKEELINAYSGVESVSMKEFLRDYAGQDVPVLGARIFEHGPYTGMDGEYHQGYLQVQILTGIERPNGSLIMIRSSSLGIAEHVFYILRMRGWYLFEQPVRYRFSQGSTGAHFMRNVEPGIGGRLRRKQD